MSDFKQLILDLFGDAELENRQTSKAPLSRNPNKSSQATRVTDLRTKESDFSLTPVISYHLERASRRTVGFTIDERGLTVRAPRWVSVAEIESMLRKKSSWIERKMAEFADWQKKVGTQSVRFVDGAEIPYLGRPLRLHLDATIARPEMKDSVEGTELWINDTGDSDEARIKDWVQSWFKNEAKRYIGLRLHAISQASGLQCRGWALSSAKGRWGSCSSDKKIRLNWRLIHLDPEVIDYVISHELAHLQHMDHSPAFWAKVGKLFPNYEIARARLKGVYIPTLPF